MTNQMIFMDICLLCIAIWLIIYTLLKARNNRWLFLLMQFFFRLMEVGAVTPTLGLIGKKGASRNSSRSSSGVSSHSKRAAGNGSSTSSTGLSNSNKASGRA